MVTDKARVASYLDDDEKGALDSFCEDNSYSASEGVAHLVRNYLIENDDTLEGSSIPEAHETRIITLEDALNAKLALENQTARKVEKLEQVITELQTEIEYLKQTSSTEEIEWFDDAEIAAVVSKPVELVRLWRTGYQKPKGKRILEKLEPYCLRDGSWVKTKVKASLESVQQNV